MRSSKLAFFASAIVVVGSLSLVACGSADKGAFEEGGDQPGTDTGVAATDTSSGGDSIATTDSEGTDTSKPRDTGGPPGDTAPPVDTGRPPDDTAVALDTAIIDTSIPDVPITKTCTVPTAKVYAGHCYFRIEARAFNEAKAACAAVSAKTHLVTIGSDGEQLVAASLGAGTDRWIGLAKDFSAPAVPTSYKWITGEASTYAKWSAGEPNGSGSCVRLEPDDTWGDRDCFNSLASICEEE
jgi:hypothetical protein